MQKVCLLHACLPVFSVYDCPSVFCLCLFKMTLMNIIENYSCLATDHIQHNTPYCQPRFCVGWSLLDLSSFPAALAKNLFHIVLVLPCMWSKHLQTCSHFFGWLIYCCHLTWWSCLLSWNPAAHSHEDPMLIACEPLIASGVVQMWTKHTDALFFREIAFSSCTVWLISHHFCSYTWIYQFGILWCLLWCLKMCFSDLILSIKFYVYTF